VAPPSSYQMSRVLEFTLQCKIIEDRDTILRRPEVREAIEESGYDLPPEKKDVSEERMCEPDANPAAGAAFDSAEVSDNETAITCANFYSDTVICRVMFVYMGTKGVCNKKVNREDGETTTLSKLIRAVAQKCPVAIEKCRVFSCARDWGNVKEVDVNKKPMVELKKLSKMVKGIARANFIVDCINTEPESGRIHPFEVTIGSSAE
ncbi:hypothetical protein PFISCL1PPCAC_16242, partial [Pristionchus fissidentatus]